MILECCPCCGLTPTVVTTNPERARRWRRRGHDVCVHSGGPTTRYYKHSSPDYIRSISQSSCSSLNEEEPTQEVNGQAGL